MAELEATADASAPAKPRRESRDSAPFGSADGLHMPGILPEPDIIATEEHELSDSEREVLRDLDEAMAEGDRESPAEGAAAADAEPPAPVDMARQRAQLPWWYATFFFASAGVPLLLLAVLGDGFAAGVRFMFAAGALVLLALAVKSWRARPTR